MLARHANGSYEFIDFVSMPMHPLRSAVPDDYDIQRESAPAASFQDSG